MHNSPKGSSTRIIRLAEKQAFESYLRRGRVPDVQTQLADAARSISRKALGDTRPTTHYTWRTARDERVRLAHAANEGRIFAWSSPSPGGHPGQAHNCRCWAEPYYGSPAVPDANLVLRRNVQIDTSRGELWASIETQTRPDGSLARSKVQLRDGAVINSAFAGSRVTNVAQLPTGQSVRVERRDGIQSIYAGEVSVPLLRSVWTPDGPKLAVPAQRVAQGLPSLSIRAGNEFDEIVLVDPSRLGSPRDSALLGLVGLSIAAAAGMGLLALYNRLQEKPEVLDGGSADVAALAFRVWSDGRGRTTSLAGLASLTAEQVAESCKRLPDVQSWTNEAATALALQRLTMRPQDWGTAVHKLIEDTINGLKREFPLGYRDVFAELSLDERGVEVARGKLDSSRLDIVEQVRKDLVCVYDVKTGGRGLTPRRIDDIASRVAGRYGSATFFIVEVRPFE